MASLSDTVKTLLAADATFAGYATGGVYAEPEISRQDTPAAFSANGEIQPCCLVRLANINQNAQQRKSVRQFVDLYFYQYKNAGTDTIDNMAARAYVLLHDQRITGTATVQFDTETPDIPESALSATVRRASYVANSIR